VRQGKGWLEIRKDDSFVGVVLGDLWGRGGVEEAWPQENVKEGDMVVERDGGEDMMVWYDMRWYCWFGGGVCFVVS